MNLGENKKIMLGLIEEFSASNINLTDDEDIHNRLNLVYAPNYQYISQEKPIIKLKKFSIDKTEDSRMEMDFPMDLRQLRKIIAMDDNNNIISADYQTIGKKVFIKNNKGSYIMEYFAYPTEITLDTPDDFELEIDQDAQSLLTYLVANDILKVDPSADYSAFYAEFERRRQQLDIRTTLPSATIEGGI